MAGEAWCWSLAGILLLATGLRFSGITAGLDLESPDRATLDRYCDEAAMVGCIQENLLHGSLHPGTFLARGPAGFVIFGIADAAVVAVRALFDEQGWRGVRVELERNPSLLHLVHRAVSGLAGVLSVFLLVRLVRREFDPRSALAAGLVLATSYAHVYLSKQGTVEALWGLGTLASLDQLFLLAGSPTRKRYVWSGLLIGASTAIKYFGALLVAPLLAAHVFARARARRAGAAPPAHAELLLAFALVPIGALVLFPGVFEAAGDLVWYVGRGIDAVAPRAESGSLLKNLAFHGHYTLWIGLGEPVTLLALAGLALAWRRGSTGRFLALLLLLLAPTPLLSRVPVLRYAIPLLVCLPATAGMALAAGARRLGPVAATATTLAVILPSLVRCIAFDRVNARPDTRAEVLDLILARAEPRKEVLAIGHPSSFPRHASARRPQDQPYLNFFLMDGAGKLDVGRVVADPPHTMMVVESDAPRQLLLPLEKLLRERYHEILRLTDHVGEDAVLPDPVTGRWLMLPFARPWSVSRPGPRLVVYERNDP